MNIIELRALTFRMNPLDPLMKHHLGQHVYFWLILPLYGLWVVLQSISEYLSMRTSSKRTNSTIYIYLFAVDLIKGSHHTPMSPLLKGERLFDLSMEALVVLRWVVLPVYVTGGFSVLLNHVSSLQHQ